MERPLPDRFPPVVQKEKVVDSKLDYVAYKVLNLVILVHFLQIKRAFVELDISLRN